jgi:hypothetical protein
MTGVGVFWRETEEKLSNLDEKDPPFRGKKSAWLVDFPKHGPEN